MRVRAGNPSWRAPVGASVDQCATNPLATKIWIDGDLLDVPAIVDDVGDEITEDALARIDSDP